MSERDVVTVRGLRKVYGTRVVVDGLDLAVRAGEIVVFPAPLAPISPTISPAGTARSSPSTTTLPP